MSQASAGGGSRLLRLGLASAAASVGAVALAVLVGGSAASAADDERPDLTVGGVGAVTQPVDALRAELDSAFAPVEAIATPITSLAVAPVAPVAGGLIDTVAPAIAPLAPVSRPVVAIVEPVLDPVLDPVHSALDPVIDEIDGAVGALPVVDDLLGEQPVAGVLDPVADGVDAAPRALAVGADDALPGGALLATAESGVAPDSVDASGMLALRERIAAAIVGAPTTAAIGASSTDRDARDARAPAPPAALPSGSSGTAGGSPPSSAITHDHLLPAPAGSDAGAIERDRTPTAPVEELTASPD